MHGENPNIHAIKCHHIFTETKILVWECPSQWYSFSWPDQHGPTQNKCAKETGGNNELLVRNLARECIMLDKFLFFSLRKKMLTFVSSETPSPLAPKSTTLKTAPSEVAGGGCGGG
jgi:hypothetical protein